MKSKAILTFLTVLLMCASSSVAVTGFSIDRVDGAIDANSIETGRLVTFHIRLTNGGDNIVGYTNGFRIYSPSGASWDTTYGAYTGTITPSMTEQTFINDFSTGGFGADTIGFGGFSLFAPGIPTGFDTIAYTLTIGPINPAFHNGRICIDSSYYPPSGSWRWSTPYGSVTPSWDGPHCYTIIDTAAGVSTGAFSLDNVVGLAGPGTLATGVPITFNIRLTNQTGNAVTGLTNGFRIYSPTGSEWGTTSADSTGAITSSMLENFFINGFSLDGMGADTVGFGGFRLFMPGIPDGFDEIVYRVHIGPIDPAYGGGQICLDSSYYRPAGSWKWSTTGGDYTPYWDGPHCYAIEDSPAVPRIVSVNPNNADPGESLWVTITGENTQFNMSSGTTVRLTDQFGLSDIWASNVNASSNTSMQAYFNIGNSATIGSYSMTVFVNGQDSVALAPAFWVNPPAQLVLIDPDSAYQGDNLNIFITGQNTHFLQASQVVVWLSDSMSARIYSSSVSVIHDELLSANFTIPNSAPPGYRDVTVNQDTYREITMFEGFRILSGTSSDIALDHVSGMVAPGVLGLNQPIRFHLRLRNNTSMSIAGSTNGFRLYSNSGANWGSTSAQWTGVVTASMYDQTFVNLFSADGMGSDTVGFGGFRLTTTGIPVGFNDTTWTIDIGPIPLSEAGKQICIDTSFYPPAGTWKWSLGPAKIDYLPTWDGPHCFIIDSVAGGIPQIAVTPDSFLVSQIQNDSTERMLLIRNTGGGSLDYQLEILFAEPLAAAGNIGTEADQEIVKAQLEAQAVTGKDNSLTVWEANGIDLDAYQELLESSTSSEITDDNLSRTSTNDAADNTNLMIESFEENLLPWPWAPWVSTEYSAGDAVPECAHDGLQGIADPGFGGWNYRTDVTVGMPGSRLSIWVNPDNSGGRAYMGFGASAMGAWSLVAAPNTNTLIIQQNSGYDYLDLAVVSQTYVYGSWYKLEVVFGDSGFVTGNLYAANGITLINSVSTWISGLPQAGVAIRGFDFCMDTFQSGDEMSSGWLRADRHNGSVPGGSSESVTLTFDASNLDPGEYLAAVSIISNDPVHQSLLIPVRMLVTAGEVTDVTLLYVDGLTMAGKLPYGQMIKFHIGLSNSTGLNISGSTNGFKIYSPTGAHWTATSGLATGAIDSSMYDQGLFINPFNADGMGVDTIGFGGFRLFGTGIPDGFSADAWMIDIGPIPISDAGGTICLDSAFYRPVGQWLWSLGPAKTDYHPTWDGPHCFQIEDSTLQLCSLSVSPTLLSFTTNEGGPNPICQGISLMSNCMYAMDYDTSWIKVIIDETGELVCIDATGLQPGHYHDSIHIWVVEDTTIRTAVAIDLVVGTNDTTCTLTYFTDFVETGLLYPYVISAPPACGLSAGDEIGLFDVEQGLLVGALSYCGEQFPLSVNAWQGDSLHGLPGYISGNHLEVQVYKKGMDQVLCAQISGGCLRFNECSFGIIDSMYCSPCFMDFCTPFLIQSNKWQTISFPLSPIVSPALLDITCDISQILSSLNQVDIVKDDHGGVYIPSFGVNTIGCVAPVEGYDLFKFGMDQQLCIIGSEVYSARARIMANRWNIMGYPLVCPLPINLIMQGITDSIDVVKDDNGGVFIPMFGINTIGDMIPGKGYKIFLSTQNSLTLPFPACYDSIPGTSNDGVPFSKPASDQVRHFEFTVTGLAYPIVLTEIGDLLSMGDEIAVFDGDLCVGAIKYQGEKKLVLNAWKSDSDHDLPGYRSGEKLDVRLKSAFGDERSLLGYQTKVAKFDEGTYAVVNLAKATSLPREYSLSQNYPNPFNPSTVVSFALPEAAHVTLEVYNLLGRKVVTLIDDDYQAGNHEVVWSGDDSNGRSVSTGVYFYRLSANDFTQTKKMMLVK